MLTKKLLSLHLAAISVLPLATTSYADTRARDSLLEEIVVTARKRSETLQDIPMAISALSEQSLERNAINNLADLQAQVPSLTVYAARGTSSTATVYIRGIGQSDPLWGVEPGVGIYLNDVYISRPQGALLDMLDVERVEVLRGPQGTLYGRNTIGGAVKYITKKPSEETSGKLDLAAGSYGQLDVRAAASGALIDDTLLASVALGSFNRDGFGENLQTGAAVSDKKLTTGRVNLEWLVSEDWSVLLSADKTRDSSHVRGAQRMLVNGFEPYFAGAAPLPVSTDRYDVDNGFDLDENFTDTQGASLTVAWQLAEAWSAKSITAWREGETEGAIDFDMGPYAIADVDANYDDEQLSQEFQLNYQGDQWQGVVGVYLLDATAGGEVRNRFGLPAAALGYAPPNLIPGPIINIYGASGGEVETQSIALYGDASWQLSDNWNLSAGVRVSQERKEATVLNEGFTDDSFTQPSGQVTADFTNDETWRDVSPRLALDYRYSDDTLVYASVGRGFKSGGFNVRADTVNVPRSGDPYDPETVVTYEMGVKSTLADQLQLNVAFFHSDYRDIQLSIFTGVDTDNDGINDSFFGDFTNAGKGEIRGVEVEYVWSPSRYFTVSGNAAYLDASYQEYLSGGVNVADQRTFTDVPELAYSINAQWQTDLGDVATLNANIIYSWRDEVQPTTNQSDLILQPAFGLWNANIQLAALNSGWRLALEGKNLADEHYRTTGYDLRDSGFPIVSGYYGDPRTVTLRASYEF
ncbi:TonB-dependent receptor [Simiduia curdlanivorans]|uniref:TonB-dependent receptor n=1 Tax=Simiduia curdlanivorans TaxID=1492769 RepID=A0ABV8V4W0_9GAMM|nr:TonB-dependent receptor [Simiduia curdlanivorans]MDN3640941.1 TonB-dependent receptor [Simiduia curdlanivorans]